MIYHLVTVIFMKMVKKILSAHFTKGEADSYIIFL